MKHRTAPTPLTDDEWEMVWLLRDVPDGNSRQELMALLRQLVAFVASPACSQSQADGVPCPTAHSSCDDCQRVTSCLTRMRTLMGPSEADVLA